MGDCVNGNVAGRKHYALPNTVVWGSRALAIHMKFKEGYRVAESGTTPQRRWHWNGESPVEPVGNKLCAYLIHGNI